MNWESMASGVNSFYDDLVEFLQGQIPSLMVNNFKQIVRVRTFNLRNVLDSVDTGVQFQSSTRLFDKPFKDLIVPSNHRINIRGGIRRNQSF
ncbi:hypothetical protein WICPIJ_009294 [Wickerhamomyces pijperi]|uniref:Uncharacterized protein n=1 Tax=Wickerhamomyces pijperi TaxID=599730 RepID=A0A9P8PP48_WICPI|nr:hypothetical protein WICPIJ_009294 [Wickerhamomyces pijperi]